MTMKTVNVGDNVSFRLDGRWEGSGEVTDIFYKGKVVHELRVRLTTNCKEFEKGKEILVGRDELI